MSTDWYGFQVDMVKKMSVLVASPRMSGAIR